MLLLALRPLDVAIFGLMGSLWIFGATFIYFVWRWAMRTEEERTNPVMRAGDPPIPPASPIEKRVTKPRSAESSTELGTGLPSAVST